MDRARRAAGKASPPNARQGSARVRVAEARLTGVAASGATPATGNVGSAKAASRKATPPKATAPKADAPNSHQAGPVFFDAPIEVRATAPSLVCAQTGARPLSWWAPPCRQLRLSGSTNATPLPVPNYPRLV